MGPLITNLLGSLNGLLGEAGDKQQRFLSLFAAFGELKKLFDAKEDSLREKITITLAGLDKLADLTETTVDDEVIELAGKALDHTIYDILEKLVARQLGHAVTLSAEFEQEATVRCQSFGTSLATLAKLASIIAAVIRIFS